MDAVILAGGRNRRLQGVVPAYWKPLIVIDQKPLVRHAVDRAVQAMQTTGEAPVMYPIIVTSPESTLPVSEVVPPECDLICKVGGPGAALLAGLRLVSSDHALVLMADNLTSVDDLCKIISTTGNVIGTGLVPLENCERFTRLRGTVRPAGEGSAWVGGRWVEKVPVTDEDEVEQRGHARCWLGPLKLDARMATKGLRALAGERNTDDLPISPLFNMFSGFTTVDVHSVDIGLPEVLP